MKLNFVWKTKTDSNEERLYLNRIRVGYLNWNFSMSKEDAETLKANRYVGGTYLPSLKIERIYGATPEEIKPRIEQLVTSWFTEALKETK